MLSPERPDRIHVAFDDHRLVANAGLTLPTALTLHLEVWPESHWPGFALRQADVFQSYTA